MTENWEDVKSVRVTHKELVNDPHGSFVVRVMCDPISGKVKIKFPKKDSWDEITSFLHPGDTRNVDHAPQQAIAHLKNGVCPSFSYNFSIE